MLNFIIVGSRVETVHLLDEFARCLSCKLLSLLSWTFSISPLCISSPHYPAEAKNNQLHKKTPQDSLLECQ